MEVTKRKIPITINDKSLQAQATQMRFSFYRCFQDRDYQEVKECFKSIGDHLLNNDGVALCGEGEFLERLLESTPKLSKNLVLDPKMLSPDKIPQSVKTIFLCEIRALQLMQLQKKIPQTIKVITPEILKDIDWESIPNDSWVPALKSIYPLDIPDIEFLPNQDLILIDSPARNLSFLPNGLAYVHNALKKANVKFQTIDIDIIAYHRYHTHRLLDRPEKILTPKGTDMHIDPWVSEGYDEWQKPEVIEYFRPVIDEIIEKLAVARPRILAFSIQACNIKFVREIVNGIKKELPEVIILVGGFSCFQPSVGRKVFPECDYMCIGEADLTIGPLVELLARGERPKDLPGVLSRFDSPGYTFQNYPMPMELDVLDMATYDWTDIKLYKNYNHYQLTPIIASRGCKWSRCTFCAERFYWRIRDAKLVVDEFEFLHDNGCDLFMFNESDLNGLPERLVAICDEIAKRGLKIKLTGQLRVHKKSDRAYFDSLHKGGFVALRFGVDAWSKNGIKLQLKGYTKEMVLQNLKDCWEAGIYTEVNTVVGVPMETEADIDEGIEFMLECNPYIGRHANMNPLLLVIGSVYWEDPERFKIKFRGKTREEIIEKYHTIIPSDLWYSEEPYIDQDVRVERFKRIVKTLNDNKVDVGSFMQQVIKDIEEGKGADHSARPDLANENDADKLTRDHGTPKKPKYFEIKVSSALADDTPAVKKDVMHISSHDNLFWGVEEKEYNELLSRTPYTVYASKFSLIYSALKERGLPLLRNRSKLRWKTKRAFEILNDEGPRALIKKIKNKIDQHIDAKRN